jgi:hypothetical protein
VKTCANCGKSIENEERITCPFCFQLLEKNAPLDPPSTDEKFEMLCRRQKAESEADSLARSTKLLMPFCLIPVCGSILTLPVLIMSTVLICKGKTQLGVFGLVFAVVAIPVGFFGFMFFMTILAAIGSALH